MTIPAGFTPPAFFVKDRETSELESQSMILTAHPPTCAYQIPAVQFPTFVDELSGDLSEIRAFNDTNSLSYSEAAIDRSLFGTPGAGDFLVAINLWGAYPGQTLPFLYTANYEEAWDNTSDGISHTAADTGAKIGGIRVRKATGDYKDTCVTTGGFGSSCLQVMRIRGNPFVYADPPGAQAATADNENGEIAADYNGALIVGGMFGGYNNCIEFFASVKRGTPEQVTTSPISLPFGQGIYQLGAVSLFSGNEGMSACWGWGYSYDVNDAFGPDDCNGGGWTDRSMSVAARYKTDDS